jgi:anti-sigma-K factor RskA
MFATAAVALVIALLSLQVVNLSHEDRHGNSTQGLDTAAASVLAHQHRTIILTAANRGLHATVAVGTGDNAYWVSSNLVSLPGTKTYQLWTVVRGAIVSLGVIGSNPNDVTAFRIAQGMVRLMVTIEPEGGSPQPTGSPIVSSLRP